MGDAFSVNFILSWYFPIQILIFEMSYDNADDRRCPYFELGLPVIYPSGPHVQPQVGFRWEEAN